MRKLSLKEVMGAEAPSRPSEPPSPAGSSLVALAYVSTATEGAEGHFGELVQAVSGPDCRRQLGIAARGPLTGKLFFFLFFFFFPLLALLTRLPGRPMRPTCSCTWAAICWPHGAAFSSCSKARPRLWGVYVSSAPVPIPSLSARLSFSLLLQGSVSAATGATPTWPSCSSSPGGRRGASPAGWRACGWRG